MYMYMYIYPFCPPIAHKVHCGHADGHVKKKSCAYTLKVCEGKAAGGLVVLAEEVKAGVTASLTAV